MAKTTHDLMAALIANVRAGAESKKRRQMADVELKVKGKLKVVLDDEVIALSLAQQLQESIQDQLGKSAIPVDDETRARRGRAPGSPDRYPVGYSSNPSGRYGVDSGYLQDHITAAVESGNTAMVGIPKTRQKAAFVIRRVSRTARGDFPAPPVKAGLLAALRASIKGGRR